MAADAQDMMAAKPYFENFLSNFERISISTAKQVVNAFPPDSASWRELESRAVTRMPIPIPIPVKLSRFMRHSMAAKIELNA